MFRLKKMLQVIANWTLQISEPEKTDSEKGRKHNPDPPHCVEVTRCAWRMLPQLQVMKGPKQD